MRSGASPRDAPATRAAARRASPIHSGVPDLVARPLAPQALSDLLRRKPHRFRPLAAQLLPPARAAIDPAERLGLDLSSLRTAEDFAQALRTLLAAVSHGMSRPPRPPAWLGACVPGFAPPNCCERRRKGSKPGLDSG